MVISAVATVLFDSSVSDLLPPGVRTQLRTQIERMAHAAALTAKSSGWELSIRMTDNDTIQAFNRAYRNIDRPTDVLAFPQQEGIGADLHPHVLGDVIVSVQTAAQQAKSSITQEILFLVAHGLCHLLGYDHQDDEQEATMNARVTALFSEAQRQGPTQPA